MDLLKFLLGQLWQMLFALEEVNQNEDNSDPFELNQLLVLQVQILQELFQNGSVALELWADCAVDLEQDALKNFVSVSGREENTAAVFEG